MGDPILAVPFEAPNWALNSLSIKAFNEAYYRLGVATAGRKIEHFAPSLHILDGVREWNKLYGSRGFYQYQCVVPKAVHRQAMKDLLQEIARSGEGSFLVVIKVFGDLASPGLMSFPMPGANLALDFPNRGADTLALLARLDRIVAEAGGRIYAAKDARMPGAMFRQGYPAWEKVAALKDPCVHSDFWDRVMA
jgi:L-gulonolactone oxidase